MTAHDLPQDGNPPLDSYYAMPPGRRHDLWRAALVDAHSYHFQHNAAYRQVVSARGIGSVLEPADLVRLLRPASLTFKSYIERIGPFPGDDPQGFLSWLDQQLSIRLPSERKTGFRRRYGTLEALLVDIERIYGDLGLEIVTSTGTSGRASMVVRDAATVELAVGAFFTGIQRVWGIPLEAALIFVMPEDTRVAMARSARFGTRQLGWESRGKVYYTMPFAASPDRIRIQAGRTFRPGARGVLERRLLHPLMNWANQRLAADRFVDLTLARVKECTADGRPIMLLGGLTQLHTVALRILASAPGHLTLPPGSRIATGGGMKQAYPLTAGDIRADLKRAFAGAAISDVYGMAEANWAAFQCEAGAYHIPPWVYAVATDEHDRIIDAPEASGRLGFFDPLGGGKLIPPFFQTADQVLLVNGGESVAEALPCECGYRGAHIRGAIRRVDLMEEAGCAAQV